MRIPILILLALLPSLPLHAQTDMTRLGHWTDGPCSAVTVTDQVAMIAHGGALEFVDVSDPAAPSLITRHELGEFPMLMLRRGPLAYVFTEYRGIHILDVSDPTAVTRVGYLPVTGVVDALEVVDGLLVYGERGDRHGLHVVDVSDPGAPAELAFLEIINIGMVRTDGAYAYATVAGGVLLIIDLRTPTAPVIVGLLPAPAAAYFSDLILAGDRLHAAVHDYVGFRALRIYDVTDRTAPLLLGETDQGDRIRDLTLDGTRCIAVGEDSITVYDVADPAHIAVAGKSALRDDGYALAVSGGAAYVAEPDIGLETFTLPSVGAPVGQGLFSRGLYGSYTDVDVQDGLVYASGSAPGLTIFTTGPDSGLRVLASLYDHVPGQQDTRCTSVTVQDGYAFLRCTDKEGHWLKVVDVSDPAAPMETAAVAGRLKDLQFHGKTGYAFDTSDGYRIRAHSYENPELPVPTATLDVPDPGVHAVAGDRLLVNIENDLWVYDIADPDAIIEIGHTTLAWGVHSGRYSVIHARDGYAYIITHDLETDPENMRIVDYRNPAAMTVTAAVGTAAEAWGCASDDGFLYVAGGVGGVEAYDLTDPAHPVLAAAAPTGCWAWNLSGDGRALFVADSEDGIVMVRNDLVSTHVAGPPAAGLPALRCAPNPFNPATLLSFRLESRRDVELTVVDARGRRVRRLHAGDLDAGEHRFRWDGRDDAGALQASGVYHALLRSGSAAATTALVLIR